MENTYNEIVTLLEDFKLNHVKNSSGNKAAGLRARKTATELKKLLTDYRKISIDNNK
jgi:hypothetical protein|tara:strand:+ start:894 stop:1064 length:171 start_codon:yes stop_codon:yes gene_type:complete